MNKKEVSEIKSLFKRDGGAIDRICGCLIDGEQQIRMTFSDMFLSLSQEEIDKYFEIFRKALSGSLGKNLHSLDYTLDQELSGEGHKRLMQLKATGLKDETVLEEFYKSVAETYHFGESYYVVMIHCNYDVPGRGSDNLDMDDASEEVYEFILCCICPVKLSEAGLCYNTQTNRVEERMRDQWIEAPVNAFLFPAFDDRSSNIHSLLYYTKKTEELHEDFINDCIGGPAPMSFKTQKAVFQEIIEETVGDVVNYDTVCIKYSRQDCKCDSAGCSSWYLPGNRSYAFKYRCWFQRWYLFREWWTILCNERFLWCVDTEDAMGSGYTQMVLTVVTMFIGLFVIIVLAQKGVKAAVILGMLAASIIYWAGEAIFLGTNPFAGLEGASFVPPFADMAETTLFHFDFAGFVKIGWFTAITLIITFCIIDMFDTIGTLVGTASRAGMVDKDGNMPQMKEALLADAVGTVAGALTGTSTVTTFVESASGVEAGGRTGLTAFTTGILFLACMFIAPIAAIIPAAATSSALIYVGILMISGLSKVDFTDIYQTVPAAIMLISMPISGSIGHGIGLALISYTIMKVFTGKAKDVSVLTYIISAIFLLKFFLVV